jgi:hypothetical protein
MVAAVRSTEHRPVHVHARTDSLVAGTVVTVTTAPAAPTSTTAAAAAAAAVRAVSTATAREAAKDRVVFDRTPADVGREALALITYPWQQRLNVTISFAGPRAGFRATSTAFADHDVVTVYVRDTDTPRTVAVSVAHELGHLIDWRLLDDNDRSRWLAARGRSDAAWWTCDYCEDYSFGSGDFAETFAAWQVGPIDYRSRLAPLPSAGQMESLSAFFR